MESTNMAGQALAAPRIVEKVTPRKIAKAVALIVLGAGLIHFSYTLDQQASLQLTVLFGGAGIALWGAFAALFGSKEKVDLVSGKRVVSTLRRYLAEDRNKIVNFIESGKFSDLQSIALKEQGDLQLSIYCTTDANYLSFQLFEWKDYTLRKVSEVYLYEGAEARQNASLLGLK